MEAYRAVEDFCNKVDLVINPLFELSKETKTILFDFQNILLTIRNLSQNFSSQLKLLPSSSNDRLDSAIKSIYLKNIHPKLINLSQSLTREYDKLKNDNEVELFSKAVQSTIGVHLLEGQFGYRAYTKPLGYAGDYELMSLIYKNDAAGGNVFEKMMHCYAVNELSSESVRYRREYIANQMIDAIKSKGEVRTLSVASGPALEISDLIERVSLETPNNVEFYLLDGDINALVEAKNNIEGSKIKSNTKLPVHYLHHNITDIITRKILKKNIIAYGDFDFIYSLGLFDYLDSRTAKILINELIKYLKPNGKLVIGNFHKNCPTKAILDIVSDWKLIYRTEEQMLGLVDGSNFTVNVSTDPQKIEIFLSIEK